MKLEISDVALGEAFEKALMASDGYGRQPIIHEIARSAIAKEAKSIEALLAEAFAEALQRPALREALVTAIQEGLINGAREEAEKAGRKRGKVAAELGSLMAEKETR